ncbi:MAG TPA: dTMP kinase [Candidatus Paceibacterota bacterium]|nr:dTMP kinase [Candidatus Paceibacterota bacterium]
MRGKLSSSPVVFTREPGGTPFAEEIRKLLVDNPLAGKSTALNNFFLFWAAREELQENFVLPALQSGKHVFSDRGDSSTYAFQLCGEENEQLLPAFTYMRQLVFADSIRRRKPDLYVIFDLPAEVARERALRDANRKQSHFDNRDIGYYERVRNGFKKFAKLAPVEFIDAARAPEEVHRAVMLLLAAKMVIPEFAFIV